MTNDRTKELTHLAVTELLAEQGRMFGASLKTVEPSQELDRKIKKAILSSDRSSKLTYKTKLLIAAAILLVTAAMLVGCVKPIRERFLRLLFGSFDDHISVEYQASETETADTTSTVAFSGSPKLGYIPENYALVEEDTTGAVYINSLTGETLLFEWSDNTFTDIDNEHSTIEKLLYKGNDALYCVWQKDDEIYACFLCTDGKWVYTFDGPFSKEEMIRLADSIVWE